MPTQGKVNIVIKVVNKFWLGSYICAHNKFQQPYNLSCCLATKWIEEANIDMKTSSTQH